MALLRAGQGRTFNHVRRLEQMGSLVHPVTARWRLCALSLCFTTTSLAKKPPKRDNTLQLLHRLFRLTESQEKEHESQEKRISLEDQELNEEQQTVSDLVVKQGTSVFFTGPAGTGKSVLLRKIIQSLKTKYPGDRERVGVTASTGLAAQNIGGTTLHRFAGIGLGQAPTKKLVEDISKNKFKLRRWLDVNVLIIDEISMIDCVLFDKLDAIARELRGVDLPLGGIQLVLTGDFFQLPPVRKGRDDGNPKFCFESKIWKDAVQHTIGLTQIYRQRDPEFTTMLNQIREGHPSSVTIDRFLELHRPVAADSVTEATELFPLRHEADKANLRRLENIDSVAHSYTARDGGTIRDEDTRKMLLKDCIAPESLVLKKGAQVMLTQNIDETLVNGSQGLIIGFQRRDSITKCRWDQHGELVLDDSTDFSQPLHDMTDRGLPVYPVVRFATRDGGSRLHLCEPMEWAVERWVPKEWPEEGWVVEKLATRSQVPLLLAWALSIHKAQGQTLDRVKVDLERTFETGQAYVALSRARSIGGLQVLNFDSRKVTVHPRVKAFYDSLSRNTRKRML